ncbi:hypothetical protein [Nonomuraea sediminis]|uniref:hypothetical protein n=1 Tax=Nonomuraea sediminis TaxID=2835864 RepID=UPI00202A0912|nr:hypothetical protein [Nonomuraea sediminis]
MATPWALWAVSVPLAVLSVIVLIGLPTLLSTPGDKSNVIVAVPGWVTIGLVLLQLVAAVWAAWVAWHPVVAVVVTGMALATLVTERARWKWLLALG